MMRPKLTGNPGDFSRIVLAAAARGDLEQVQWLLTRRESWLHYVGPHGRTMLWEAAYRGHLATARFLAERGAAIEQPGCYATPMRVEVSPLTAARSKDHRAVAAWLIEAGAKTDFHDACYLGDAATVARVLGAGADLAASKLQTTGVEATPLHYAIAGGQPELAHVLLDRGAPVDNEPGTLLGWALELDDRSVADRLLGAGIDHHQAGSAAWAFDPELRALAARHGFTPDPDQPDDRGFPALVDACRGNHNAPDDPERVGQILAAGAAIDARDHKGKTALHRASQAGFVAIGQLLLARGAPLEATDAQGETPLFDAVRAGRRATVALLLAAGAERRTRNGRGQTVKDLAARLRGVRGDAVRQALDEG